MTTKYKIIIGFVAMMLLMGFLALLGYSGLQEASNNFNEYRHLARVNVALSDMLAAQNYSTSEMRQFRMMGTVSNLAVAQGKLGEIGKLAEDTKKELASKERLDALDRITKRVNDQVENIKPLEKYIVEVKSSYSNKVQPELQAISTELADMIKVFGELGNTTALGQGADTMDALSLLQAVIGSFAQTRLASEVDNVRGRLRAFTEGVDLLGKYVESEKGRAIYVQLKRNSEDVVRQVEQMIKDSTSADQATQRVAETNVELTKLFMDLNALIDTDMRAGGTEIVESNATAQNMTLLVSVAGIALANLLAAVITMGIVRVLKDLSVFANFIARGDFTHQIKTREKGEIGSMVTAMREIPQVLGRVTREAQTLAETIRVGKLRERLVEEHFEGSFADLAHAVNTVGKAYTGIIDALPIPIMACNAECRALFYNTAGQATVGGNLVNSPCREQLNAPECGTMNCFGKRAMESRATVTGETTVRVQGKTVDVSVSAMPLFDKDGKSCGFFEVLTDLAEIKAQQRTMMHVAEEAAAISNRVAAASEELAAQVEQISRGTEVQRERIEGTASAMTEMNSTVMEVARNAGQAADQTENTRSSAENGAGLVKQVVSAINDVNRIGCKLQENMHELGEKAEKIGGVMNVISDIADQTNLLALNAAIEAARAGEAGRGFAVVADEVRKLAEKTMAATQEVGANIESIQHAARMNIDEVKHAVHGVGKTTELANASGSALEEIVNLASSSSIVVTSIATAAEEQSATSEEISRAIDEINRITGETAASMVQSSEAVQEFSHMAQELRRIMQNLQ